MKEKFTCSTSAQKSVHPWLRRLNVSYVPGESSPLLDAFAERLLATFQQLGHTFGPTPTDDTDILLTTAPFEEPIPWRQALLFTARRRFRLKRIPAIYTLISVSPDTLRKRLAHFADALNKDPIQVEDFRFPGLAPEAHQVLIEQGKRGGAILALERLLQAQSKSIHLLLVVGDDQPEEVYHFNLVGAYPRSLAAEGEEAFYTDIVLRTVTTESTHEITEHLVQGETISREEWNRLNTPQAMCLAGQEIGRRGFFTQMVRIADLVRVPAIPEAVASQYSEGCFSTWDPDLGALIATVTGSARPVDKGNLTEGELAVIVGVRPDGKGAVVRHVEGKRNDPPSSEAVEMIAMDGPLPRIRLESGWGNPAEVPVIRSKLHGHRGVRAYDPTKVEFVRLDPAYYYYPVSCATAAQAQAIKVAFSRAECLRHPEDLRQVAFCVLPGHGVVIVEKWVPGKSPLQVIWEFMDAGWLEIDRVIPQGMLEFKPAPDGRHVLKDQLSEG